MKRKFKFYLYTPDSTELKEVKWFRTKFFGSVILTVSLVLVFLLGADYYVFDILGFSHERVAVLTTENQVLQDKLASMTSELKNLEKTVKSISSAGDELRLAENLPPLTEEEKQGSVGGVQPELVSELTSSALNDMLGSASSLITKLSGEVQVQKESYEEILSQHKYNQNFFKYLPALKPMDGPYARNDFGMRKHPVLGVMKFHEGVDIINDIGTPVYAPADGTVEFAGFSGNGYGITLIIKHGFGYETIYGHLSKTLVKEGQKVKRGDVIAKCGNTGLVSGPHLHYEVHLNGVLQNPMNYFFDDLNPQEYRKQVALQ